MKVKKRMLCLLSVFVLCITNIWNQNAVVCFAEEETAVEEEEKKDWFVYVNGEMPDITLKKGESIEVSLPITANYKLNVSKVIVNVTDTPFVVKGAPAIYQKGSVVKTLSTGNYTLKFSLTAKKGTEDKTYSIPISFLAGTSNTDLDTYDLMDTVSVTYQNISTVASGKGALYLTNLQCIYDDDDEDGANELNVGENTDITYDLTNIGSGTAYDITITYEGFSDDGILPKSKNPTEIVSSLKVNGKKSFNLPITPAQNATNGTKVITINVSYKETETSTEYITESLDFYVYVMGKKIDDTTYTPKLRISNYVQTPEKPQAGAQMTISFDVTNVGTRVAKKITIIPDYFKNTTFTPLDKDPNAYIETIEIGEKKTVTFKFRLSELIEGGLSQIEFNMYYKDHKGLEYGETFRLFIRDIVAQEVEEEEGTTVPKIMIQQYATGADEVAAGEEFTLSLDIMNAHDTLSADNIKVTLVTGDTSVFTTASGSNNFYITQIPPQGTVHKDIQMRVKADVTTEVYPLKIEFEYEYDGLELPKEAMASGITIVETLSIQVVEDTRPEISGILVGAYGDLVCGELNSMTLDLTNLGKSPLYNVELSITGDYQASRESYFLGKIEAGTGASHEFEITPLVEGVGDGVITVTYEDSNGVEGVIAEEFSAEILPTIEAEDEEEPEEVVVQVGEPLLPTPVFLIIQVVLFGAGTIFARSFILRRHAKKEKQEEKV